SSSSKAAACALRSTSTLSSRRTSGSVRSFSASPRSCTVHMRNKITSWVRRQSLARKLTGAVMITAAGTLLLACAVLAAYDYSSSRARFVQDVTTIADVIGNNSTGALAFGDQRAAGETLRGLSVLDHIVRAELCTSDGRGLAIYTRNGAPRKAHSAVDPASLSPDVSFRNGHLRVRRAVLLDGQALGTIVVESDQ